MHAKLLQSCLTLWPHGLWYTRLPCPLLSSGVYSNTCPLCRWCHPTISSSVASFSFCLQSFPESGSFPMSQLFPSSIGCFNFSISPSNEYSGWFPLRLASLISLQSKGLSRAFSSTTVQRHQFFGAQPSLWLQFLWLLMFSSSVQDWSNLIISFKILTIKTLLKQIYHLLNS